MRSFFWTPQSFSGTFGKSELNWTPKTVTLRPTSAAQQLQNRHLQHLASKTTASPSPLFSHQRSRYISSERPHCGHSQVRLPTRIGRVNKKLEVYDILVNKCQVCLFPAISDTVTNLISPQPADMTKLSNHIAEQQNKMEFAHLHSTILAANILPVNIQQAQET